MASKRPNLSAYFRGRIDWHTHGMLSGPSAPRPADVARITGDVTDREITVTMRDGTVWRWEGGHRAARKANGCYAPLMPKPITDPS